MLEWTDATIFFSMKEHMPPVMVTLEDLLLKGKEHEKSPNTKWIVVKMTRYSRPAVFGHTHRERNPPPQDILLH